MSVKGDARPVPLDEPPGDILARLLRSDGAMPRIGEAPASSRSESRNTKLLLVLSVAIAASVISSAVVWFLMHQTFDSEVVMAQSGDVPTVASASAPMAPLTAASDSEVMLETSGYVVARNKAFVSSDITGRIRSILVGVGQSVERGDPIALLDDREARLRLTAAELRIEQDRLAVEAARVALRLERERFEPIRELRSKGVVSTAAFDQARAALDAAEIQVKLTAVNLSVAENNLGAARIFVERHVIESPFDGVVVEVPAREGETVSPASGGNSFIRTGIVQIVDPLSLYVVAEVPERQFSGLRAGQPVDLVGTALGGAVHRSEIEWIAPVSNRQRSVVDVGIKIEQSTVRFIDGMEVEVHFLAADGVKKTNIGTSKL
jgi:RND family efflux transporter MFP subunit